jgi:hypothetical protein
LTASPLCLQDEMDARMTEAARNHKRYMFYFERFKNHADSIQKEKANRYKGNVVPLIAA